MHSRNFFYKQHKKLLLFENTVTVSSVSSYSTWPPFWELDSLVVERTHLHPDLRYAMSHSILGASEEANGGNRTNIFRSVWKRRTTGWIWCQKHPSSHECSQKNFSREVLRWTNTIIFLSDTQIKIFCFRFQWKAWKVRLKCASFTGKYRKLAHDLETLLFPGWSGTAVPWKRHSGEAPSIHDFGFFSWVWHRTSIFAQLQQPNGKIPLSSTGFHLHSTKRKHFFLLALAEITQKYVHTKSEYDTLKKKLLSALCKRHRRLLSSLSWEVPRPHTFVCDKRYSLKSSSPPPRLTITPWTQLDCHVCVGEEAMQVQDRSPSDNKTPSSQVQHWKPRTRYLLYIWTATCFLRQKHNTASKRGTMETKAHFIHGSIASCFYILQTQRQSYRTYTFTRKTAG